MLNLHGIKALIVGATLKRNEIKFYVAQKASD